MSTVPSLIQHLRARAVTVSGGQNNYRIPGDVDALFVIPDPGQSAEAFSGFSGWTKGTARAVLIVNAGATSFTIQHQSTSSDAANRIITQTGANLSIAAGEFRWLIYDPFASRWRV